MAETLLVLTVAGLVKVVHVELAHKAAEVIVLEVPREDILRKCVRVFYYKAGTLRVPENSVPVSRILNQL